MIRWIAALSTLLMLSGCVTTREVVYRDGYSRDAYAERRYYDDNGDYYADEDRRTVYRDGSYYTPGYAGSGDYYSGSAYGYESYSSSYWEYPAYYSVFWPMYRSWHDPYWYPNYYYGVTYYPRNYFSVSFGSGWGRPYASSWYYSPYRYSWVDNYYDWSPWRGYRHSNRDYRHGPRYGSSRNEAERLARLGGGRYQPSPRRVGNEPGRNGGYYGSNNSIDRYGRTRGSTREADYRSRDGRQEPATAAFGLPTRSGRGEGDVRRTGVATDRNYDAPVDASVRRGGRVADDGRLPERPPAATRGYEREGDYNRRYSASDDRGPTQRQSSPYTDSPRTNARRYDDGVALPRGSMSRSAPAEQRGYAPATTSSGMERRSVQRDYSRESAPAMNARRYEVAPMNTDRGGRRYESAPAPVYSAPSREPSFQSRPEPRYESRSESRSEPRFEARQESRPEPAPRYESRQERSSVDRDRGGVRRVGSDRDDRR
jgi:hypothetical protein